MTLAEAEAALETGLAYIQALAPLAGSLGGPTGAAIARTVTEVASTASAVLAEVEADAAIIAGGDLTKIRSLEADLQTENVQLGAKVDES